MSFWPAGYQSAAVVSVNFDGESFEQPELPGEPLWGRYGYGRYGAQEGVYRLLNAFERYGVIATFFVPGWDVERYPDAMAAIVEAGHEVAGRGYANENFALLTSEDQRMALERGEQAFIRSFGRKPVGWRGPHGLPGINDPGQRLQIPGSLVSPDTRSILAERGYLYDSSYCDDDLPYVYDGTGLVELPVHSSASDRPYYERHRLPGIVGAAWIEELSAMHAAGGLFNLTLSPRGDWGSGRQVRIRAVETVLQAMHETSGLWVATCREVAEHARSAAAFPE
jgi:peptidoglycan-N-acetylglucosamine deacetylase